MNKSHLNEAALPKTNGSQSKTRVVIVGAGFGGLAAAKALEKTGAEITIIDKQNYHCFQPLLYQVATAALSPADIAWPIRALFRGQRNVRVLLAAAGGIDTAAKFVFASGEAYPYDYLILASGATHSYFGHPDWAKVAPGLKTVEDATAIRRAMLLAFEKAELAHSAAERRRNLRFVIVGGGPTGVELAGAIASVARETLQPDFRNIDTKDASIKLIEGGPRILPSLPAKLSDYAQRALNRMGVEVETSTSVTKCTGQGVETTKGLIEAATIIWAAGVVASPVADWLGVAADRAGRVAVNGDLSVPEHPEIFVIGDAALVEGPDGMPVPGIAPAAKQMGDYVGRKIIADLMGKPSTKPFRYRHQGDLATIGRGSAVVKLRRLTLKGMTGWLFWSVAHIYFLVGVRNRIAVAWSWLWDYVTFQRGARLITGYDSEKAAASKAAVTSKKALPRSKDSAEPDLAASKTGRSWA